MMIVMLVLFTSNRFSDTVYVGKHFLIHCKSETNRVFSPSSWQHQSTPVLRRALAGSAPVAFLKI